MIGYNPATKRMILTQDLSELPPGDLVHLFLDLARQLRAFDGLSVEVADTIHANVTGVFPITQVPMPKKPAGNVELEEFNNIYLDTHGTDIWAGDSDHDVCELFETGSMTMHLNNREYVLVLTVQEQGV